MENTEKAKPDIEYFFGVPLKVYCGKCERLMFTSTFGERAASVEMFLEHNDRCPWCGCEVDKEVDCSRHE